jgi:chlorite dismutase
LRENYARADEPGVVIVFELDSVEQAKRYVANFPMSKAGYREWFYIPLQAPLPIENLMDKSVDTGSPYDRVANTT